MVVARNQEASSYLGKAWRERDSVKKVYLAHVKDWPPYNDHKLNEGTIAIPLASSRTERIKWEARPVEDGGKECKTYWKVQEDFDIQSTTKTNEKEVPSNDTQTEKKGITLELHPITGRTHQLRIHAAEIGSGIVGDSLYGDEPIEWFGNDATLLDEKKQSIDDTKPTTPQDDTVRCLRLNANKLVFPHPKSGEKMTFESSLKSW